LARATKAGGGQPLFYHLCPTALGWVGLVLSPRGLRGVALPRPTEAEALREVLRLGASAPAPPEMLGDIPRRFQDYAHGLPVSFDEVAIDWEGLPPFHRRVLEATRAIPRGQVRSYADLARLVGRPGAARAVGQAMARNPLAIVVPCHRVVASDGTLGGYGGGLELKRRLLALEGSGGGLEGLHVAPGAHRLPEPAQQLRADAGPGQG